MDCSCQGPGGGSSKAEGTRGGSPQVEGTRGGSSKVENTRGGSPKVDSEILSHGHAKKSVIGAIVMSKDVSFAPGEGFKVFHVHQEKLF